VLSMRLGVWWFEVARGGHLERWMLSTLRLLETMRLEGVRCLAYASSSTVASERFYEAGTFSGRADLEGYLGNGPRADSSARLCVPSTGERALGA
jgi:hypothetical protein